jgi:hypothetical protein
MSALPVSLEAEAEAYVVVEIVDDVAQTDELHLPAMQRSMHLGNGVGYESSETFEHRIARGWPPSSWPSACGSVARGSIYVRGGVLEDRPICAACREVVGA